MDISIDILDYLGKHEGGILALISLGYEGSYYESTFYYTEDVLALTTDEKLEEIIGIIEDWEHYNELLYKIIQKVVPHNELINSIQDFDPDKYGLYLDTDDN